LDTSGYCFEQQPLDSPRTLIIFDQDFDGTAPMSSQQECALSQSPKSSLDPGERVARERPHVTASLLASIVESSDDGIYSIDLDCIITSWNKGAEQLFGYTAAEAVGRPVAMLIPLDRQYNNHDSGAHQARRAHPPL